MKKYLLHKLFKRRREKKLIKKGYDKDIKVTLGFNCFKLRNSLKKEDEIYNDQEILEDILSHKINHVEKISSTYSDDFYKLYFKDFTKNKNYSFKKIKRDTVYLANNYKNKEVTDDFNETQSVLILARPGGGKTQSARQMIAYHKLMIEKFYSPKDKKTMKDKTVTTTKMLIIDKKGNDFKNDLEKGDYFFRLDNIEDYQRLSTLLDEIIYKAKKATRENRMTSINWIFVIDEILLVFNKERPADKDFRQLILKIEKQFEEIIVSWSRVQRYLTIACSQSFSIQDSSLNLRRFGQKLISRPQNNTFATVLGSKLILRKDLVRGRFVLLNENIVVQFPESLSVLNKKTQEKLKRSSSKNLFCNMSSSFMRTILRGLKKEMKQYSYSIKKMQYRRFVRRYYDIFYYNYCLVEETDKRDLLRYGKAMDKSEFVFIQEREFRVKTVLRNLYMKSQSFKYDKKSKVITFNS